MTLALADKEKCSGCGSSEFRAHNGFIVCTSCGLVQSRDLVQHEHLTTPLKEMNLDCGGGAAYPGRGIHTVNSCGSQIGNDRISIVKIATMKRMKRLHNQSSLDTGNRLYKALSLLSYVAENLGIPKQTRNRAAYVLRMTLPRFRHGVSTPLVFVSLIYAIREHRLPIQEKEVLKYLENKTSTQALVKAKFAIMEVLGITWPFSSPLTFIPGMIADLLKSNELQNLAEKRSIDLHPYLIELERCAFSIIPNLSADLGGKHPRVVAASVLYSLDRIREDLLTQRLSARVMGISEGTLRDHWYHFWTSQKDKLQEVVV